MHSLPLRTKLFAITIGAITLMALALTFETFRGISHLGDNIAAHSEESLHDSALNTLQTNALAYGNEVSGHINSVFRVPVLLAAIIESNLGRPATEQMSREQLHRAYENVLKSAPYVSAVYTMMEPNGYNPDEAYAGSWADHSMAADGSMALYWVRNPDGTVVSYKLEDPQVKYQTGRNEFGQRESEWFLCPREQKKPCIVEPYLFQITEGYSELMTSLTAPVMLGGKVQGVVGIDINLPVFQQMTDKLSANLYDGAARVTLVSSGGLIVAASHYKEKAGRPLNEVVDDNNGAIHTLLSKGGVFENDDTMFVAEPLLIGASGSQWSLMIELPVDVAMAGLVNEQAIINDAIAGVITDQMITGGVLAILTLILMTFLIRSIVSPIDQLNKQVKQLSTSHGDLTQTLDLHSHAELIELSGGFNRFLQKLRDMINTLKDVSASVRHESSGNQQISRTTQQNTSQQQQEMDNVVTATQEMSATAHEVSGIAGNAAEKAKEIHHTIKESQSILSGAADSVLELSESMATANDSISRVAARSDDINQILEVIRNVAEQTNLLALNAAIEAARAGEQGRGFAVVADEVRTLASKTHASTEEIDALISSLQQEVNTTVGIIELGGERASGAMDSTQRANTALHEVVQGIGDIADHINQVATAAEEQSATSSEITRNLTIIGDATQTLARLAGDANHSSEKVSAELDKLDAQLHLLNT